MTAVDDRVALDLGRRLRSVREQQGLTLRSAAKRSGGRFAASLLGAYERGERAVSVQRLAELADVYDVPVRALLPEAAVEIDLRHDGFPAVSIDLSAIDHDDPDLHAVERFVQRIRHLRNDPASVITIRSDDMELLSSVLEIDRTHLAELLGSRA
jgi:transcriptional regulator with XRE-family HTH domain